MSLIVKEPEQKEWIPAPEGTHQSVCVDVVDLGMVEGFGQKMAHKVELRWQLATRMESGDRFLIMRRFTASLHPMAHLRDFLETWRGKAFTEEECQGFDLEVLLGANAYLTIVHKERDKGGVWANVKAATAVPNKRDWIDPEEYVRMIEREPQAEDDEDDIPF